MKLGLLVVLAVAVLVPSLSEGRIVSRCELKAILNNMITLPENLQNYTEIILKEVICELEAKSRLNTSVELDSGEIIVATSSVPNRFIREAGNDTSNTTMEEGEMSHEEHEPISNEDYTNSHGNESGSEEDENEPITDEDEDEDEYEDEGEDESVSWEDDTTNSDSQMTENDMRMMELLNMEESKFDEEQMEDDDNKMSDDEEESEEESQEDLEDADERGGRMRRDTNERKIQKRSTWSLKYYGLFQLSDSHFCQSEDRWSRNVCNSTCSAFTDDNINDDVGCFVNSNYWWYVLINASPGCIHGETVSEFFSGCD